VIDSFAASYVVGPNADIRVTETIDVDFGGLERHGIFRDIPVRYSYDDASDRLVQITEIAVSDGSAGVPFTTAASGDNFRIRIGDPDTVVSGAEHYEISYLLRGAMNAFDTHDELYWNITGHDWPVTIGAAEATVRGPAGSIVRIECFQGGAGSNTPCRSSSDGSAATFATGALSSGSGLTVVVGFEKGAIAVPPPELVDADHSDPREAIADFLGPLWQLAFGGLIAFAAFGWVARQWWVTGRDRWFGDMYYLSDQPTEKPRPLFAHETIVPQFEPPEVPNGKRRLRPAEVGVLLDERADQLDLTATIVDLAVRGFLSIREIPKESVIGRREYELTKMKGDGDLKGLLEYERTIYHGLFGAMEFIRLAELDEFWVAARKAKEELYDQAVRVSRFFPSDPESVRGRYRLIGIGVVAAGGIATGVLGQAFGLGFLGLPVILAGGLLALLAPAMPRRTALGRDAYRQALGFRIYMVTAEQDRQRFAEQIHVFDDYLPYAIVFGCTEKWAKVFSGLDRGKTESEWYSGPSGFVPLDFAAHAGDFSANVSSAMAAPSSDGGGFGSGGSGFGGGGGVGGGGGGGGGGSW
jgi:hypothetical protein